MTGLKSLWDAKRVALVRTSAIPTRASRTSSRATSGTRRTRRSAQRRGWLGRWADAVLAGNATTRSRAPRSPSRCRGRSSPTTSASRPSCRWRATSTRPTARIRATGRTRSTRSWRRTAAEYEIENTPSTLSGVGQDAISSSDILQTVGTGYVAMGAVPRQQPGRGAAADRPDHQRGRRRADPLRHLRRVRQPRRRGRGPRPAAQRRLGLDQGLLRRPRRPRQVARRAADDLVGVRPARPGQRLATAPTTAPRRRTSWWATRSSRGSTAIRRTWRTSTPTGICSIQNDFRSYYGTILSDWLGADSAAILGAGWPNLGFLNKSYA